MTMADASIRPLEVHVPEEDLVDLRRRIAAARWPGNGEVGAHRRCAAHGANAP
jgi:hypothetical protein